MEQDLPKPDSVHLPKPESVHPPKPGYTRHPKPGDLADGARPRVVRVHGRLLHCVFRAARADAAPAHHRTYRPRAVLLPGLFQTRTPKLCAHVSISSPDKPEPINRPSLYISTPETLCPCFDINRPSPLYFIAHIALARHLSLYPLAGAARQPTLL